MAKTIKFNLICDGNSIRTIEELRNNFSVEDVLSYYQSGLLERWLKVRGYNEELKQVETVDKKDELSIIKSLIKIFEIEANESDIEQIIYSLQYQEERAKQFEKYAEDHSDANNVITDYFAGYCHCIDDILQNKDDMSKIKTALKEIDDNYHAIFELDFRRLFYIMLEAAPMAIYAMLMRENMRVKYIPKDNETVKTDKKITLAWNIYTSSFEKINPDIQNEDVTNPDTNRYLKENKNTMYKYLCDTISADLEEDLGDNLKEFLGKTDGEWKLVEPQGKKYMVLKISPGTISPAEGDIKLRDSDVNGSFPIIDGITYRSDISPYYNKYAQLLYLEV